MSFSVLESHPGHSITFSHRVSSWLTVCPSSLTELENRRVHANPCTYTDPWILSICRHPCSDYAEHELILMSSTLTRYRESLQPFPLLTSNPPFLQWKIWDSPTLHLRQLHKEKVKWTYSFERKSLFAIPYFSVLLIISSSMKNFKAMLRLPRYKVN